MTYKEDLDEQEGGADDDAKQEDHCFGRHDVYMSCVCIGERVSEEVRKGKDERMEEER